MMKLYQREDCPFSQKVRGKLTELGLSYLAINVPADPRARAELIELCGQAATPVLVDDDDDGRVVTDADTIVAYLQGRYGKPSVHEPTVEANTKSITERPAYGMTRQLAGVGFHAARERVQELLTKEGFGILSVIDITAMLKAKLNCDLGRRYLLLGVCQPRVARDVLTVEPYVGLLLPCNVVVTEADNGDAIVSAMRPVALVQAVDNRAVKSIADRVEATLLRVMTTL